MVSRFSRHAFADQKLLPYKCVTVCFQEDFGCLLLFFMNDSDLDIMFKRIGAGRAAQLATGRQEFVYMARECNWRWFDDVKLPGATLELY